MKEKREMTRSEIVRLRRRQQVHKRPAEPTLQSARPLPAITARGHVESMVARRAITPGTKRRYQGALSLGGVQVRMPTLIVPHFEVGWRLLSFTLLLLFGTALYLAWTLPEFRVPAAQVSGNARLSADEINSVMSVSGQPIFALLPSDLETRLRLNYPELASAHVAVGLPNLVSVRVTERQPVILWQQNSGYTWIDKDGVAFRPRGGADGLIPVVALGAPAPGQPSESDALSPVPYISSDLVKSIRVLAPSLPSGAALLFDPAQGLGWSDERGWRVFFGDKSKDMPLKLQVYQTLVDSLMQRGLFPVYISVQQADAPYYRMSQ